MVPLLVLVVIALPLLEMAVLSQLLVWAPWPLVLAVVVLGSMAGLLVMRQGGLDDLRRWRLALRQKRVPQRDTVAGGLRDCAGVLLLVPGVVSTVAGLALLNPSLRSFLASRVVTAGKAARARAVPRPAERALLALPSGPAPVLAGEAEAGLWVGSAVPFDGHIAGADHSARDAVETSFFGPGSPPGTDGLGPPADGSGQAPAPPRPPAFGPHTFVQPSFAVSDRWHLARAQTASNEPGSPPVAPAPPAETAPWSSPGPAALTEGTEEWDRFMAGSPPPGQDGDRKAPKSRRRRSR